MFRELLHRLTHAAPQRTPLPPADARHAMGALLVRVAKADHVYLFEEIEEIDHILARLYGLNQVEAAKMRAACERLEEQMPDTEALAHLIGDAVPVAEREAVVEALWQVVDIDGARHDSEVAIVAIASETFGLSPERAGELRGG